MAREIVTENPEYGWLNAPFLFAENDLYHRIAQICGFFSNGFDYFRYKKEAEVLKERGDIVLDNAGEELFFDLILAW